jgi:prepilin-type N-terminal cleavage/methylation domain-containing protein
MACSKGHGFRLALHRKSGFTLIELMVVLGIVGVLAAFAVMVMPTALRSASADSDIVRVASALRSAREQAISQRRFVLVTFTDPNQVVISVFNAAGTATTPLNTVELAQGVTFSVFPGMPDTPDAFSATATPTAAVSFGGARSFRFSSEGICVDLLGDTVNGTVFVGQAGDALSARAVSVFGPTALVREWRWNGNRWTD